ncbi:kelch-like protein 17 [Rhagoletis pomonella]|uniref:kelch-like protein 17 n=1 Tax=Rhagoletis pomonella TaxID=28610 RepID=UPI0017839338|nr:kelch-like protein 17 [Rhagoletis pomonella]
MATKCTRQLLSDVNSCDLPDFIKKLVNKICDFYDEQDYIDVTFKLSNPIAMIPAHRLILSAASPYFNDLFKSEHGLAPVIELNDIDSDTFERLMTFCYTGKTLITIENVDLMLKAAMVLQLCDAVLSCVDYILEHITEYTLKRAYDLERETQCIQLYEKLLKYEIENFIEVSQSAEFLNFSTEKLQAIIEADNLNVSCEQDAFRAIKRWYEYDASARQKELPVLIDCLRLTQLDVCFLMENVQTLPGCEVLALRALSWIGFPSARSKVSLKFSAARENVCNKPVLLAVQVSENLSCSGPYTGAVTNIFQYDKAEDEWHIYADIETSDWKNYGLELFDNSLMFIGGKCDGEEVRTVKSWSFTTKTWITLPPMGRARSFPVVLSLNKSIYAIGGQYDASVERYSPVSGWRCVSNMSSQRYSAGAVVHDGKIFIMGGWDGRSSLKSVERYDPSLNSWTKCADMNAVRRCPAVAVHNGCIYVLGGGSEIVERYDPQSNKWTKICSLSVSCNAMACVSMDDQLWAIGGNTTNSVSVYNAERDEWIEKKKTTCTCWWFILLLCCAENVT